MKIRKQYWFWLKVRAFQRWKEKGFKSGPSICEHCDHKGNCKKYKFAKKTKTACLFKADCFENQYSKYWDGVMR